MIRLNGLGILFVALGVGAGIGAGALGLAWPVCILIGSGIATIADVTARKVAGSFDTDDGGATLQGLPLYAGAGAIVVLSGLLTIADLAFSSDRSAAPAHPVDPDARPAKFVSFVEQSLATAKHTDITCDERRNRVNASIDINRELIDDIYASRLKLSAKEDTFVRSLVEKLVANDGCPIRLEYMINNVATHEKHPYRWSQP